MGDVEADILTVLRTMHSNVSYFAKMFMGSCSFTVSHAVHCSREWRSSNTTSFQYWLTMPTERTWMVCGLG